MPSIKKCYDPEFLYAVIQACRKNGCEAYIHGPENKQFNLTFVALGYNLEDAAQAIADMGPWFRNVSMEGVHHTHPYRPKGHRMYPLFSKTRRVSLRPVNGGHFGLGLDTPCTRLQIWDDTYNTPIGILGDCEGRTSLHCLGSLGYALEYGADEYLMLKTFIDSKCGHSDTHGVAFFDGTQAEIREAIEDFTEACYKALETSVPDWVAEAIQWGV